LYQNEREITVPKKNGKNMKIQWMIFRKIHFRVGMACDPSSSLIGNRNSKISGILHSHFTSINFISFHILESLETRTFCDASALEPFLKESNGV